MKPRSDWAPPAALTVAADLYYPGLDTATLTMPLAAPCRWLHRASPHVGNHAVCANLRNMWVAVAL